MLGWICTKAYTYCEIFLTAKPTGAIIQTLIFWHTMSTEKCQECDYIRTSRQQSDTAFAFLSSSSAAY